MSIKKTWNSLSLGIKYTLVLVLIMTILLSILGLVVYFSRKSNQTQLTDARMQSHTNELLSMLELHYQSRLDNIDLALPLAKEAFISSGQLSLDTQMVQVSATNQHTLDTRNISMYPLTLDGIPLWNDNSFVDNLKASGDLEASLFQRVEGGFMNISTTLRDNSGQRTVGTYISNDSPIVQSIIENNTYTGRVLLADEPYIATYEPIYVNGQTEGLLYIATPAKNINHFEEKLKETQYYQSGYPLLLDAKGVFQFHPYQQGENISNTTLFSQIQQLKNGNLTYQWPETGNNKESRKIYFRYYEPYDIYVATSVNLDEVITKPLAAVINLVVYSILIGILILFMVIKFMMTLITKPLNQISQLLSKLSQGIQVDEHDTKREDEIGKISYSLNQLITGLKETAVFANEIEKKNFDYNYTPLSKDDVLGNALLDMRESLKKAGLEDEKRQAEDRTRNWITEGLAKFSDILRMDNDNLETLSFNVIQNLVKYLNINQGGLFVLNDERSDHKILELTACYAYDRQKFLSKTVEMGEGITGTCLLEKETIYLKDIPQDYINITSGLGEASPSSLLVVPLKLNEEIYGVLELASFDEFKPHEIEFVEKIGESIASTLSAVKTNMRTSQLLEQAQQQGEEMKAQEEEMRQNMEEMQTTQDELHRRNAEMKNIQENLDKESSLLQALLQSSEDTIYFKDKDSKFLRVSNSLLKLWGETDQKNIMGLSDFDLTSYEEAKPKFDAEQEIIRTGKPLKIEERDIDKEGNIKHISTVKMPLMDGNGNVIGTFGVSRDITDIRETLDKARENEKLLIQKAEEIQKLQNEIEKNRTAKTKDKGSST